MARCSKLLAILSLILISFPSFCCTSVIISGKVRADGRPLMLKHRDSDYPDNRMEWFRGEKYSFTGLVNSSSKGGEVWTGINSAGFCIMNTATYDLKDDDIPQSQMDKEGIMMYNVLGICKSVDDFQHYLDTLSKPWGVEANFGIIDSFGGAAYFEVNNHEYVRFDVDDQPGGYMVVTNFTRTGRKEDRHGVDRFEKASEIMKGLDVSTVGHEEIFNKISRSYLPILRDITTSALVVEGVPSGTDPSKTVLWTILGCPSNCIYLPLMEKGSDTIPSFMKRTSVSENCMICTLSLGLKNMFNVDPGCVEEIKKVEEYVDARFSPDMREKSYEKLMNKAYRRYIKIYSRKMAL